MNEKYLWELWSKCKHPHPKYGGGDMIFPMEFAELIVRDCLVQIEQAIPDTTCASAGPYKTAKIAATSRVRKHFGVEE